MASVDYILIASGSIVTPKLDIAIYTTEDEGAKIESEKIVAQLSLAGYFTFWLYSVKNNEEHFLVETFSVEQQKPIVTRTKR